MDNDPTDLYKQNNQHNSVQKCRQVSLCSGGEQVLNLKRTWFKSFEPLSLLSGRNSTNTARATIWSYGKRETSIDLINSSDYSKIYTALLCILPIYTLTQVTMEHHVPYCLLQHLRQYVRRLDESFKSSFFCFHQVLLHKHFLKTNLPSPAFPLWIAPLT